jgi:DNA-binding NtrC family response regulator
MKTHRWEGNIRELKNCVERVALKSKGDRIEPADLFGLLEDPEGDSVPHVEELRSRKRGLSKEDILLALSKSHGNKTVAAAYLGINRQSLHRLIRKQSLT